MYELGIDFYSCAEQALKLYDKLFSFAAATAEQTAFLAVERASDCEVWAIDSDGSRLAPVPVSVRNGRLTFVADMGRTDSACFHYEIFRKKKGQ